MLTFNYSNKDYRICFQHWTEKRLSAEIENSNILLPNPGRPSKAITNCILQALSTVTDAWFAIDTTSSFCNPVDQFEKDRGRKLSLAKLLQNGKCPVFAEKSFRTALWQAYLERKNKVEYKNDDKR